MASPIATATGAPIFQTEVLSQTERGRHTQSVVGSMRKTTASFPLHNMKFLITKERFR